MRNADAILRNLEYTKYGIPLPKRIRDFFIKGVQLNWCYQPHWDEVRSIFRHYKVDLRHQGPIMTIQTLKEVQLARTITEEIKSNREIREMAERVSYPLHNVYPAPNISRDELIDGTIFIVVLRLIPQFCLQLGQNALISFFENGNAKKYLFDLFATHGTIIDTQRDFEKAVLLMIKDNIENFK